MNILARVSAGAAMFTAFGLAGAVPAHAACGDMDMYRDPSTYVNLYWSDGSTYTRIEPHGTYAVSLRAVIDRYSNGSVSRYYGPYVQNAATYGTNRSYVSATNGSGAGNGYSVSNNPGPSNTLYNDYGRCKAGV